MMRQRVDCRQFSSAPITALVLMMAVAAYTRFLPDFQPLLSSQSTPPPDSASWTENLRELNSEPIANSATEKALSCSTQPLSCLLMHRELIERFGQPYASPEALPDPQQNPQPDLAGRRSPTHFDLRQATRWLITLKTWLDTHNSVFLQQEQPPSNASTLAFSAPDGAPMSSLLYPQRR